ncbi:hypothetical protein HKBW3S42_02456, partial [Candidatus Hakubella thermalkaliphila]
FVVPGLKEEGGGSMVLVKRWRVEGT